MLDCEFTVVAGPLARRKFWQTFTVVGGKVDEQGVSIAWKISKGTLADPHGHGGEAAIGDRVGAARQFGVVHVEHDGGPQVR